MNIQFPETKELERHLVGLAFLDGAVPLDARVLTPSDFTDARMRGVWSALMVAEEEGGDINPVSILQRVKRTGADITLTDLLATYSNLAPMNPIPVVRKLQDASATRRLMKVLGNTLEGLSASRLSLEEAQEAVRNAGQTATMPLGGFRQLDEIIEQDVKPALATLADGKTLKLSTGFYPLDKMIGGGLSPSDVMVVAALTGQGKSAFALQMSYNLASKGHPVAFLSGEMRDVENGLRLVTQASGTYNLNSQTFLHKDQYDLLVQWADYIKNVPIYFDSRTFNLRTLRPALRSLVDAKGIKVLVIDYLQLFSASEGQRQTRTERIAETSQEVRRLALEFGIAIVEVVQFNREGAKSGKPQLHDLEGSSQLEKDASIVVILDRDEETNDVLMRIVKGRNAPKADIRGTFDGPSLSFDFGGRPEGMR